MRAPSASTSTAPAKASSTAIATTVAAEVLCAAAIGTLVAALGTRIFLRGIELPKILRSGGVGFRLALLRFGLKRAISLRLTSAVRLVTQRRIVLMLVGEIRVQRLLVRNGLLREVISA